MVTQIIPTDKEYKYNDIQKSIENAFGKKNIIHLNIFEMSKLFLPINFSNTHWTLAVVYMEERRIRYHDSLYNVISSRETGVHICQQILRWLFDAAKNTYESYLDVSTFTVDTRHSEEQNNDDGYVPKQTNGVDCGVFTIMMADYLSDDLPLQFSQKDIPRFREKIACAIVKGMIAYQDIIIWE
jgi:sentrin-specific protease 1